MKNHARTFYEIYSSPRFANTGKQNDTLFNRLGLFLETADENTISEYMSQCRLLLREIRFDVEHSSLSEEAKRQYTGIIQKVQNKLSKNQPWTNLGDVDLPAISQGFLFLSEQKDVFSFHIESSDRNAYADEIAVLNDEVENSGLRPEHKLKIETALSEISLFLSRDDTASYELAWAHLSKLMADLFRIKAKEPGQQKTLDKIVRWGGGTLLALHMLAQVGDDARKLTSDGADALRLIESVISSDDQKPSEDTRSDPENSPTA